MTAHKTSPVQGAGSILSTVSGPSDAPPPQLPGKPGAAAAALLAKASAGQALAAEMEHNPNKAGEHGAAALAPQPGTSLAPPQPSATASTAGETTASPKVGAGVPPHGVNPANGALDRVRVDSGAQRLTTNH